MSIEIREDVIRHSSCVISERRDVEVTCGSLSRPWLAHLYVSRSPASFPYAAPGRDTPHHVPAAVRGAGMKDISNTQPKYLLIPFKLVTSFPVPPGHREQPVYVFLVRCFVSSLWFAACLCFFTGLAPSSAESKYLPLKKLREPHKLGFLLSARRVDTGLCLVLASPLSSLYLLVFCRCPRPIGFIQSSSLMDTKTKHLAKNHNAFWQIIQKAAAS